MIGIFSNTRQNKLLADKLDRAIKEVIDSGIYILGPKVLEFEKSFAQYLGVKYAVGVASGTDAISLALLAVGIERGDEVIMPSNAYPTVFALSAIGAVPKLVDIDPATYNIDANKISAAITSKTKAIIAVHLYGHPADLTSMNRFIQVCGKKIALIEDCAQAHGAEIRIRNQESGIMNNSPKPPLTLRGGDHLHEKGMLCWKKVGTVGDVGCFSFYPTKNLGCFGDGGMVVTNNKETYDKLKLLRMYGEEKRYKSVIAGRNSRLDEIQAAILLVKLKYLDEWNARRREIARQYLICKGSPCKWPYEASYARHVYHLFVIRTSMRDELKDYLEKKGIGTAIHYPAPIHLQPSFKYLGYKQGDFPESEKASREVLSLPMYPELTGKEVEKVVEAAGDFCVNKSLK